jgi:hypothetical protein
VESGGWKEILSLIVGFGYFPVFTCVILVHRIHAGAVITIACTISSQSSCIEYHHLHWRSGSSPITLNTHAKVLQLYIYS